MAISKQTGLDMLRWFKERLDDDIDEKIATLSGSGEANVIESVKVNNNNLPVSNKAVNIDLSAYAKKSEITSGDTNVIEKILVDGTEQPVTDKAVNLSLSAYATKNEVTDALNSISSLSTVINSLSNYQVILDYDLQPATTTELGGIKVGYGLEMDANDVLNVTLPTDGEFFLAPATKEELGGIIVGSGLSIKEDGTLSVIPPESVGEFFLAPATYYDLGGVIVGNGLSITDEGVLSTAGQSNIIENISIDGINQPIIDKTAILRLSAYAKKNEVGSGIRMKGSVDSFDDLPTTAEVGDLYNIKNDGGVDGEGIAIIAGDNVVYTDKGTWDVMAGFVDTSNFVTKDDFSDELKEKLESLSSFTLLPATESFLGGIKVGGGLSITSDGILSARSTNVFQGADENGSGDIGLVPAPLIRNSFLRGDGYWASFPDESLNVIVGGGSLNGVNVEAISYPPNMEGVLWMDTGGFEAVTEPCLRLRHGDYEYIFKADFFNPTTVNSSTSTSGVITPAIYYLGTVPSEQDGGLWYTLNNQHPTLYVHRKWTHTNGDVYSFDFGYNYDLIAYKGSPSTGLVSYFVMRENLMSDVLHKNWTTSVPAHVIEKTDFGIYALRNLNTALTNTTQNSDSVGWILSNVAYNICTIDFWLSWNADSSEDSVNVVGTAGTFCPIIKVSRKQTIYNGTVIVSSTPSQSYFGILDTGFAIQTKVSGKITTAKLSGYATALETKEAKRIHVALVFAGSNAQGKLYLNGKLAYTFTQVGTITAVQFFGYLTGTQTHYRPLYIDHFRIWNKAVWTQNFEPPKKEDYIIW